MQELPNKISDCFASDNDKYVFWLSASGKILFEKTGAIADKFIHYREQPRKYNNLCKKLLNLPYLDFWGYYGETEYIENFRNFNRLSYSPEMLKNMMHTIAGEKGECTATQAESAIELVRKTIRNINENNTSKG